MCTSDLRSSHALVANSQLFDHPLSRCDRDLVESSIFLVKQRFQFVFPTLEARRARVVCLQSFPVLHRRICISDGRVANAAAKLMLHRHRKPLRSVRRLDLIAILNAVLAELNRVKVDEYISRHYFVHIRWPGKILWLVNGDLHLCATSVFSVSLWFFAAKRSPQRHREHRGCTEKNQAT